MSCFKPITGYQVKDGSIVFNEVKDSRAMLLPCGRCIGCRIEHSKGWATRMMHEASLHEENCFITLTYNAENCPPDGGLIKKHFQDFMKRLRRAYPGKKMKYYHCGEYGDKSNRPHYHAILFGHNFNDWIWIDETKKGQDVWTSPTLEKIWGKGFVTIGQVTFESCAYVARYVLKKLNGPATDKINEETGLKYYERINSFTGEICEVLPEYSTMSRGGRGDDGLLNRGIAYNWIDKFRSDVYPKDFTTINGTRRKPPRYYDTQLKEMDIDMYDDIKQGRVLNALEKHEEGSPERLKQRAAVMAAKYKTLKRSI